MKTMKKLFGLFAMVALLFVSYSSQAQIVTDVEYWRVPSKAQSFVKTYLKGQVVEHSFISRVTGKETYNVVMRGRSEVIFDTKGEWLVVDGHGNGLNYDMLPRTTKNYIKYDMKNIGVKRIARDNGYYLVTFSDESERKFDSRGRFVEIVHNAPSDLIQ